MFVKICGITTEQDALLAVAMGADAVGFVFAPSPRQVSPLAVAEIVRRLPSEVITVGVFRDSLPERVLEIMSQAGLKAAQLHGQESKEDVATVAAGAQMVIKAFPASSWALDGAADYKADAIMIDGPSPGSGKVFDWHLTDGFPRSRRIILAGGLTAENVTAAIERVRPWGVDVSSGVESSPGHKDPRKVRAFIKAVRAIEPPDSYEPTGDGPYDWQEQL